MKRTKLFIIFLLISSGIVLNFSSCKKDKNQDENNNNIDTVQIFGDYLSVEDNLLIESVSVPTPPLDSLLDANGVPFNKKSGSKNQREQLINQMVTTARNLCAEKTVTQHNEAIPNHTGYAYGFASRNIGARANPRSGNSIHKSEAVWGTDCSGLMIILLRSVGIQISDCSTQEFETNLNNIMQNNTTYSDLKIVNKGHLGVNDIKAGDIVLWKGKKHLGLIGEKQGHNHIVLQSNGDPYPANASEQTKNHQSLKRGVHPFSFNSMISADPNWGTNYVILRFEEKNPPNVFNVTFDGTTYSLISNIFFSNTGGGLSIQGFLGPGNTYPVCDISLQNFVGIGSYDLSTITTYTPIVFKPYGLAFYYNCYIVDAQPAYNVYNGNINITLSESNRVCGNANAILYLYPPGNQAEPHSFYATFDFHN